MRAIESRATTIGAVLAVLLAGFLIVLAGSPRPAEARAKRASNLTVAATPALSRVEIDYDERHSWRGRR